MDVISEGANSRLFWGTIWSEVEEEEEGLEGGIGEAGKGKSK